MTRQTDRPWWASEGPVDGGIDRSEDPVVRHRSARLGDRATDDGLPEPGSGQGADDDQRPTVASRRFGGNGRVAQGPVDRAGPDHAGSQGTRTAPWASAGHGADDGDHAPADQPWWTQATDEPATDEPAADEPAAHEPAADGREPHPPPHRPELCGVCPICAGFRVLEDLRPELAGHLAEAAYHLAAALRSLAEQPSSPRGGTTGRSEPTTMQHIDVE